MHARRRPRKLVTTRAMERRKRRRRALVALGITSALVAGVGYGTWQFIDQNEYLLDERCEVTIGDQIIELSPEQTLNAALISAAAPDRGLPPEAAVHAVAMSMQEADLIDRADNETADDDEDGPRALFARGTPSWSEGPAAQVAETSIAGFYDVLEDSWRAGQDAEEADEDEDESEDGPEFWEPNLELDDAAEVLARPHNPQFYPQHYSRARAFAWPLAGQQPVGMTCYLSQLEVPGPDPEGLVDELVTSLPRALEIPFTEPDEDDDQDDDEEEEFVPEPILDDVLETTGQGENATLRIHVPAADDEYDYQWLLAQWAVALARDYGIQTVEAGPHVWQRDNGRWDRAGNDPDDGTSVSLRFGHD